MPFMTILFIFSFCFVFYIIWHQFLRKDARLSIGLKVLQRKMNMLETLSKQTDLQLAKGIELLDKKNKDLEKIVNEARFCIFKMEKMITRFESKNLPEVEKTEEDNKPSQQSKIQLVKDEEKTTPAQVKLVKEETASEKTSKEKTRFDFGDSPFNTLSFKEDDKKKDEASILSPETPQDLL